MNKFKSFVLRHKLSFATACATAVAACPTLAAEGVSGSGYIQSAWISDLLPNISADVSTMMPVGIGIMALFIGIGLIPRIIYKFMG